MGGRPQQKRVQAALGAAGGRDQLCLVEGDNDFLEQVPADLSFEVYSGYGEGEEVHWRQRKYEVGKT